MDLGTLGEDSLTQFVGTVKKLLLSKDKRFELLAGAGDSGQIMVFITKIIYEVMNIDCPPTIIYLSLSKLSPPWTDQVLSMHPILNYHPKLTAVNFW